MIDIRNLWDKAVHGAEDRRYEAAILGALDGISVTVPGRTGYVYARRGPNGELGEVIAKNSKVAAVMDLPVKMRLEAGQWVIREAEGQFSDPNTDPGKSGVYPHAASHQHGGTDEVATATPANNAIPKADGTGKLANGWLDATLASLAALGTVADRTVYTTGVDTWAETPLTPFARTILDDANIAAAQATLALVPGTNVQAFDAELAAIAGLTSATDKGLHFTGSGTAATHDLTAFGRSLLAAVAAANARTTLGLIIGTDVQAQDAELQAIAGLTSAADRLPYFTGSGTASLATFSAFARSLIDDADAAAARATIGAVGLTGDENVGGIKTFTSNPRISKASAKVEIDATSGNPSFGLYENGVEKWGVYYNITNNYFAFGEAGVADHFVIKDGGNFGMGVAAPAGKAHIDQSSTTAAIPVLVLEQADLSEEMIEFVTTVGAGNPIDTAIVGSYYGKVRVNVAGVGYKYIPLYNT